uniref:Uncharacterized protein n=1 Tax=Anopheles minimus TaxID=112268 RepID=A0A182WNV9_9DIPT
MRAHATSSDRRRSVGTSLGPPRSDWNSWLWQLVSSRAVRIKREDTVRRRSLFAHSGAWDKQKKGGITTIAHQIEVYPLAGNR